MVLITRGKFKGWSAGFFISPPPYPDRNSRHEMWWAVCTSSIGASQREYKRGTGKVVFGLVLPRSHPLEAGVLVRKLSQLNLLS
jgi:hypothetical protein